MSSRQIINGERREEGQYNVQQNGSKKRDMGKRQKKKKLNI